MSEEPKRILITGANRGIGREIARELARRGQHVIVASRRLTAAQETAAAIREAGGKADALEMDVSDSASINAAADRLARQFDRLDVLVNNAGIYPDKGLSILTVTRQQMGTTFATNTFGALEVVQRFLPMLLRAGHARVINMSSGYGQISGLSSEAPSYCLSKLGLNGLTIMLAPVLKDDGIVVNSVCPGWVRTEMGGKNAPRTVEQGADTAVWLALDAGQNLTGKFFRDRAEIPW